MIFYRTKSLHTNRFFIADKKSDIPYDYLSECHLTHTAHFLSELLCCNNGIIGFRHSDFLLYWSQCIGKIFIADKLLEGKVWTLLDQKSAHSNWFFVCLFKKGPCALGIRDIKACNVERLIHGYPRDAAMAQGSSGSYRWFVYITLLLWEASGLLDCIVGHLNCTSAPSILLVLLESHWIAIVIK